MAPKKRSPEGETEAVVHPDLPQDAADLLDGVEGSQPPEAPSQAQAPALKTVQEWAQAKGHIPVKKPVRFRGDAIHSGKHVAVICAHAQWPLNKVVSEKDYDDAADAAYSLAVGEQISAQKARLEEANARAEAMTNAASSAERQ